MADEHAIRGPADGSVQALQSDNPTLDDRLDRTHAATTLANLLLDKARRPKAIAIFGSWGAGKSTLARLVERAIRARWPLCRADDDAKLVIANFNAWDYEQAESMAAALAQCIADALTQQTSRWKLKLRFAWANYRTELLGAAARVLAGGIVALGGAYLALEGMGDDHSWKQVLGGGMGSLGLSALWVVVRGCQSIVRMLEHPGVRDKGYLDLPSFHKHLGFAPALRSDLRQLARLALGEESQLVIVVDDVDRCKADSVVAVFEAVRLVANFEGVSVILVVDERVVLPTLARPYERLEELGGRAPGQVARDYLAQLVQASLRLGAIPEASIKRYIHEDLFAAERDRVEGTSAECELETVVASQAQVQAFAAAAVRFGVSNPRQLRRLRNSFHLLEGLYGQELGSSHQSVHLALLFLLETAYAGQVDPETLALTQAELAAHFEDPRDFEIALARVRSVLLPSAQLD